MLLSMTSKPWLTGSKPLSDGTRDPRSSFAWSNPRARSPIFCVNLTACSCFRSTQNNWQGFEKAIYPSGAKTDPRDAQLLAEFILNHRGLLRAAPENQPEVEALDLATRQRRKTVDQITKETQKITQLLKEIYPAFLKVFPSLTDTALEFLKRFPSVEALHKSKGHYIQEKLSQCKRGNDEQLQHYTQLLTESVTLEQSMLAEIHTIQIKASIAVITTLRKAVKEFDKVIARLYVNQDKSGIFDSLPGAGKALAPRLLVSFALPACQSVQQLQCYSGIAPIIRASGNSRRTCFRVGRPKFLHQSILEFADRSVRYSTWANAYFKYKQKNGESTNSILRKIAFKWMRIIWRCLENNQNYDEQKYIQTLKKNNVPYIN